MDTQPSKFYYILPFPSTVLTDITAEDDLQRLKNNFCAAMTTPPPYQRAARPKNISEMNAVD